MTLSVPGAVIQKEDGSDLYHGTQEARRCGQAFMLDGIQDGNHEPKCLHGLDFFSNHHKQG